MQRLFVILAFLILAAASFPAQGNTCAPMVADNPLGAEIAPPPTPSGTESALTRPSDSIFNSIYVPQTKVVRCAPGQFQIFVSFLNTQAPADPLKVPKPLLSPLYAPRAP